LAKAPFLLLAATNVAQAAATQPQVRKILWVADEFIEVLPRSQFRMAGRLPTNWLAMILAPISCSGRHGTNRAPIGLTSTPRDPLGDDGKRVMRLQARSAVARSTTRGGETWNRGGKRERIESFDGQAIARENL